MKKITKLLLTAAIMTAPAIGSYAQSNAKVTSEKFILLFRGEDTHIQTADYALKEVKDYIQLWINWQQNLAQKGILVSGDPLKTAGKQISGKNKIVTDGPLTVSNETVDGYLIINAKNLDNAVEIAKGCPLLTKDKGKVEVRQIQSQD